MQLCIKPAYSYINGGLGRMVTSEWYDPRTWGKGGGAAAPAGGAAAAPAGGGGGNNIQAIATQLSSAAKAFAKQYNEQIRNIYNPSITSITNSVKELMSLDPGVGGYTPIPTNITKPVYQFIAQLNALSQEDAKDTQTIRALATSAQQISQSIAAILKNKKPAAGAAKPGSPATAADAPMRLVPEDKPAAAPATAPATPAARAVVSPSTGSRGVARSQKRILTANIGSAKYILHRA